MIHLMLKPRNVFICSVHSHSKAQLCSAWLGQSSFLRQMERERQQEKLVIALGMKGSDVMELTWTGNTAAVQHHYWPNCLTEGKQRVKLT